MDDIQRIEEDNNNNLDNEHILNQKKEEAVNSSDINN